MIEVTGKAGIKAKILADSVSSVNGKRITSFELEYPRYVHAELLTHRLFSRNAASSRAIPVKKKLKMIWKNPVFPIKWGKNKPGMQSSDELTGWRASILKFAWKSASKLACISAWGLMKLGLHKQWAGRVLEPFERYKVVLTATEFENWFWLRDHEDAQPEIRELARVMSKAREESTPFELYPGEWHLPYVSTKRRDIGQHGGGSIIYKVGDEEVDLETAQQVSASCCAQVSYRVLNQLIEKAKDIFSKLIDSVPVHASPTEHQATPISENDYKLDWNANYTHAIGLPEEGITHYGKNGNAWSGNFCGWIQYRQLIPNNVKM